MALPHMHGAPMCLIGGPGLPARLPLGKRQRFLFLQRGRPAYLVEPLEPGTYDIDVSEVMNGGEYPVGVLVIKAKHARLFLEAKQTELDAIIDSCIAAIKRGAN